MRFYLVIFLIVGFTSIAVFGFLGMDENMAHKVCLASTVLGSFCPQANMFAAAVFHANAFKSFSLAFFALLLSACASIFGFGIKVFSPPLNLKRAARIEIVSAPLKKNLRAWLALRENSR